MLNLFEAFDSRVVPNVPSQYRTRTFILIKVCIIILNESYFTELTSNVYCWIYLRTWQYPAISIAAIKVSFSHSHQFMVFLIS